MSLRPTALIAALLLPATSSAQTVRVTLDDRARELLGARTAQVEKQLGTEFEQQTKALVGELDIGEFLQQSANAQALVHKSLGTDYSSVADGFIIGASIGAAIDTGDSGLDVVAGEDMDEVPIGAGAQITLMLGYNFADQGVPELTIFAHGMGAPISISEFEGSFYNFGATAQYRVIGPYGSKWLGWGGISLTSGVEVSRMRLTIASADMLDFDTRVGGVRIRGDSDGSVSLVQNAVSIPLEVTTALTTLYVFTLYAGIAGDLNFGSANLMLDVDTTVTAGGQTGAGSAEAFMEDDGDPDRLMFRVLGGLQANLGPVHLFAQANLLPKDLQLALAAGLRVSF